MSQLFKIYANGKLHYYQESGETFERITAAEFYKTVKERRYKLIGYSEDFNKRIIIYTYYKPEP